jgi:hypothetical protein
MKKFIFKSRHFILAFSLIVGSLYLIGCQTDEVTTELEDTAVEADIITSKRPFDPDLDPPSIPVDAHCVVRLAYLSYLERCPENAGVVGYWINVFNQQGFGGLAVGFITSPEASQRWNSRYQHFLNRNNITSYQINKKVYIAYRGLLLREPDVAGGIGWTNVLRSHGILAVANGIGSSAEFQRRLNRIFIECNNAANRCQF